MRALEGKSALVTGGGSGIGLASAQALLDAGSRVAIAGRDAAKLHKAAESLAAGYRLRVVPCNVTDKGQVHALVADVTAAFGRIDILVNNAGANVKNRAVKDLDEATWDYLIRVNLDGAF